MLQTIPASLLAALGWGPPHLEDRTTPITRAASAKIIHGEPPWCGKPINHPQWSFMKSGIPLAIGWFIVDPSHDWLMGWWLCYWKWDGIGFGTWKEQKIRVNHFQRESHDFPALCMSGLSIIYYNQVAINHYSIIIHISPLFTRKPPFFLDKIGNTSHSIPFPHQKNSLELIVFQGKPMKFPSYLCWD